MSLIDEASLVQIPSGYKEDKLYSIIPSDGSGDLNFSRASTATRVNAEGLIEEMPYNLLTYSNDFSNVSWLGSNYITADYAISPDGTQNASRCLFTGANQVLSKTTALQNGVSCSATIYIKGTSGETISLAAGGVDTMQTLNGEWQRIETNKTSINSTFVLNTFSGATARDFLIYGAQLNSGSTAKPYFPTTDRLNVPRIDYTGGGCGKLLLEPQRTNLITYSSDFSNTGWQYYRGTITANATISPDGTLNASKYEEDSQTGGHLFRRQNLSITNGLTYTGSIFAKKGELSLITLQSNSSSRWVASASFDLENGTVTSGNGVIENYGNGWYRCSISGNAVQTTPDAGLEMYTSFGVGRDGDGLYMYGAMFELGSYETSYIPTSGATATRIKDTSVTTGLSSVIGQTEGTMFVEIELASASEQILIITSDAGNEVNRLQIYVDSSRKIGLYRGDASVSILSSSAYSLNSVLKIAAVYKSNDYALYINGVSVGTDTSATIPPTPSLLYLGSYVDGSKSNSVIINQAQLYKTKLTDEQLADLTGEAHTTFNSLATFYNYTIL